ncbi:hypothetical protein ACFL0V_06820 [Nanoarchaeota archaeon]
MNKTLEDLKFEAELEKRQRYMEKFGFLPKMKNEDRKLGDFN